MLGLAHSLADPKGKEEERDEATHERQGQIVRRVVGRGDLAGVIWVVDKRDRVSGGAGEGLRSSAFDDRVDPASSVSKPYPDCLTLSPLHTIDVPCADDDSLCSDTVADEACVVEPLQTPHTRKDEGEEEVSTHRWYRSIHVLLLLASSCTLSSLIQDVAKAKF